MLAGVPQGSTLSPILYNLYTSGIPKSVQTELSVYADDICIYNQNRSKGFAQLAVQRHLKKWEYGPANGALILTQKR